MRKLLTAIGLLAVGISLFGITHAKASGAAFVQGASVVTNAASFSVSYPGNVTAGDLLVVFYRNYDDTGGNVTDTLNGTTHWSFAVNDCTGWDVIAYIKAPSSGADTVTIYSRQSGYDRATIMEYSGLAGTLVTSGSAHGPVECGTSTEDASVSLPSSTTGGLIVAGFTTTDNSTSTAGTIGTDIATLREHANSVNGSIQLEDDLSSTGSGAQSATLDWSNSPKWFADVAEFS